MSFHRAHMWKITAAALCVIGGASTSLAQSAGNPKGSVAPAATEAPKSGAQGASTADGGAGSGPLYADPKQAEARRSTSRSPGTGTAGGLPKRTPMDGADASRSAPASKSQPTRHPTAPATK